MRPKRRLRLTPAVTGLSTGTKNLVPVVDSLTKSTGLARHELINLSRQVQDTVVSIGSGQSIFTVLLQQGTQIGDVFANSSGTVRGFGGQLASVVTPARVLGVGLAGVGVGAALMAKSIVESEVSLANLSDRTETTTSKLRALQQVSQWKGVDAETFAGSMTRLADLTALARRDMGGLADLFRVNGKASGDLTANVSTLADLIKNAASETDRYRILTTLGLPATAEMVRFWKQGGDAIQKATGQAQKFNEGAAADIVKKAREFDEAWNKAWSNFTNYAKAAGISAVDAVSDAVDFAIGKKTVVPGRAMALEKLRRGQGTALTANSSVDQFYGGISGSLANAGNGKTRTPDELLFDISKAQTRISILGTLPTVAEKTDPANDNSKVIHERSNYRAAA
jgi:hypothetical protein